LLAAENAGAVNNMLRLQCEPDAVVAGSNRIAYLFFGDRHKRAIGAIGVKSLFIVAALLALPLLTQSAAAQAKLDFPQFPSP
jgi:hypothetical protein